MIKTKAYIDGTWPMLLLKMHVMKLIMPLKLLFKPRRFQVIAIGTSKSGTHSLAGIFGNHYRSAHEPNSLMLNKLIIDRRAGLISEVEISRFYRLRDSSMRLEMESNAFNYLFIDSIVECFPEASYILPFREPKSWLNSWINHTINRREADGSIWKDGMNATYQPNNFQYGKEKELFQQYELYPIDCYLNYWHECNQRIINAIPKGKLLVIRTNDIGDRIPEIATFLGIDSKTLDPQRSHEFKSIKDHQLLEQLPKEFINSKIDRMLQTDTYKRMEQFAV